MGFLVAAMDAAAQGAVAEPAHQITIVRAPAPAQGAPADVDTGTIPALLVCTGCPSDVFADEADSHGRCPECAGNAVVLEALARVQEFEIEQSRVFRARQALDAVAEADPIEPAAQPTAEPVVSVFDYLALGVVAASTDEDDAVLNAQIMLMDHHDPQSIEAGLLAWVETHPLAGSGVAA